MPALTLAGRVSCSQGPHSPLTGNLMRKDSQETIETRDYTPEVGGSEGGVLEYVPNPEDNGTI